MHNLIDILDQSNAPSTDEPINARDKTLKLYLKCKTEGTYF